MKKHYAMWLLASGLLPWTNLDISDAAAPCRDTAAPTDPRLDMILVPRAMDPHSSPDNQANAVGADTRVLLGHETQPRGKLESRRPPLKLRLKP
jgi:hypothetical protein